MCALTLKRESEFTLTFELCSDQLSDVVVNFFLVSVPVPLFPNFFFCALPVGSVGAKPEQYNFIPSGECVEDRAERQQAGE